MDQNRPKFNIDMETYINDTREDNENIDSFKFLIFEVNGKELFSSL